MTMKRLCRIIILVYVHSFSPDLLLRVTTLCEFSMAREVASELCVLACCRPKPGPENPTSRPHKHSGGQVPVHLLDV